MCICCISLYYTIVNIYKDSKEDLLLVMDLSEKKNIYIYIYIASTKVWSQTARYK